MLKIKVMKAQYLWSEALLNLFMFCQNVEQWFTWSKVSRLEDFRPPKWRKDAQRKPYIPQPRVSWTLKNLIFRSPKDGKEALSMLDTYRSSRHATWVIAFSGRQNAIKVFTRNQVPNSTEWHFQGIRISIWPNRCHITFSRGSYEISGIAFSCLKNAEK